MHAASLVRIQPTTCHEFVTPHSRSDPNGGSEPSPGRETIYCDSLICSLSELTLVPVFLFIYTIFVITKNHLHIYKRTTTGVVSIKIYTHILSLIYLYKHLYLYMSNTKHHRLRKQCGEHLSLSWPALLMWDVLSSILVFCCCTYTD